MIRKNDAHLLQRKNGEIDFGYLSHMLIFLIMFDHSFYLKNIIYFVMAYFITK
jgi:hypothetical protein